jgi:hypothetical protein
MPRRLVPQLAAGARRRRRTIVVASLPVVLAGIAFAVAGGSGTGTAGKDATKAFGMARASSGSAAVSLASTATTQASPGPHVGTGTFQGVSPAVSSLSVLPVTAGPITTRGIESLKPSSPPPGAKDPVVQGKKGTGPISGPIQNFDGICLPFGEPCSLPSSCSCLPPDTNGEVGATQYVQMVNTDFAVFSKTGAVLKGATPFNQLWANAPDSECKRHNDGDPVVVYDQLANRWLLSQFIARDDSSESYGECIAVSTSSDATGAYYLYEFLFQDVSPDTFHDYPKLGVWPDGYYMSTNEFPDGQLLSSGAGAFAFERSKMIAGLPARFVYFDEAPNNPPGGQYVGQLPGDLDGKTLPPAGAPNLFAEIDDATTVPPTDGGDGFKLRLWKFHVDWATPANSTFGNNGKPNYELAVAPYVRPQCVYGYGPNCVPQKGGAQDLDTLGDRLMFRLPYRNFGKYASLVLNHSVVAGDGRVGMRWYEVRIPTGSAASLYQQGTYAPADGTSNPLWRWMGSVAQDKRGDIAAGFSASGPNDYPSVRYTGRGAGDPLGQFTQAEQVGFTGTGPQTEVQGRWGDYSDLTVDPVDDCTFWYTQEYLGQDLLVIGTWRTRVVSFKFPACKK